MIKKMFLRTFFNPILCNSIDHIKYPWGWKSYSNIQKVIDYPISDLGIKMTHDRKFIHEYRLNEYAEEVYQKTYYAYVNNYDFLNSPIFSPKLANGLNFLRPLSDLSTLDENINVKNVKLIGNWVKHGRINNTQKIWGLYNDHEIVHEISAGMIGPEIKAVWDQPSIKQKVRLLIETDTRKDVLDFERDMMISNNNWQLCNINRIII